jgi:hypothetical protein
MGAGLNAGIVAIGALPLYVIPVPVPEAVMAQWRLATPASRRRIAKEPAGAVIKDVTAAL